MLFVHIICCSILSREMCTTWWRCKRCSNYWPHNWEALEKTLQTQYSRDPVYSSRQPLGRYPCPSWSRGRAMPPLLPGPSHPAWCSNPLQSHDCVFIYWWSHPFHQLTNPLHRVIFNPSTPGQCTPTSPLCWLCNPTYPAGGCILFW